MVVLCGTCLILKSIRRIFTKTKCKAYFAMETSIEPFDKKILVKSVSMVAKTPPMRRRSRKVFETPKPKKIPEELKCQQVSIEDYAKRYQPPKKIRQKLDHLIDSKTHQYLTEDIKKGNVEYSYVLSKGFQSVSKPNILEHKEMKGWLIKGGPEAEDKWICNVEGICVSNKYDNLLRVVLAEKIKEVIQQSNLEIYVPTKMLYKSKHAKSDDKIHKKYHIVVEKLELSEPAETAEKIRQLTDKERLQFAVSLCDIIEKTGFMDSHFANIRWCQTIKKFTIIDTETLGLYIEKTDSSPNVVKSVQECARIGLQGLANRMHDFPLIKKEAEQRLKLLDMKLSQRSKSAPQIKKI